MTINTQKLVRVLGGPTGPTGSLRGVNILSAFTGFTGEFPQWAQATGATGPNGTFESVYNIGPTGLTGQHKNVIISGYSGGGGGGGSAFNPADKTNMTLSNGNLTATPAAAGVGGVRGTKGVSAGKVQLQFTNVTFVGAFDMCGIGDLAQSLTGETSVGNEFMYGNSNDIYCNGNSFGAVATPGANATFDFCFDFTAKLGWARVNGGVWNLGGTANPATGVGGLTFTGTTLYPFIELSGTTAHGTLNTTPSGLITGFSAWG